MFTNVGLDGRATMHRQDTKPGDHVDLLALMDVLAVPNVCGSDVMRTSNFSLKPIKLTVFAATEADLIAHCKAGLAGYKAPTSVEFRDSIPRTATGKVQKFKLRQAYWSGQERQIN